MNTSKTLVGFLLFSLAALPGCSKPANTETESTQSTADKPSATESPADSLAIADDNTSPRMLPTAQSMTDSESAETDDQTADDKTVDNQEPESKEESNEPIDLEEVETPSMIAAKAFTAPAGAKSLSKKNLWIDRAAGRVYADGYIAMNDGPLEMFACPSGTKEHETIIATLAKASELHAGLLAIGAQVGTPVTYNPSFIPATGQRIRVWVCYFDDDGKYQVVDARDWIVRTGTTETLKEDWVFAGSYVWTDPVDNRNYYQGDVGDMICVSNFTTAMLDIPVASSADTDQLQYSPNTAIIPGRGTAVRLILEPIPLPADGQEQPSAPEPPTEDVLQKQS